MVNDDDKIESSNRRKFLKRCLMGGCGLALGAYSFENLILGKGNFGFQSGSHNNHISPSWKWVKEASWYSKSFKGANIVQCELCPLQCLLDEGDRGPCLTRIVQDAKLYTVAYNNPCAAHVDPIEKKPFYHFLPATRAFSIATAGCNLHCLNCQNWDISQSQPEGTSNMDMPSESVVQEALNSKSLSIAYTYSEPIIFYEYAYDTALIARDRGLKNLLVTAGFINPEPLRQLCKVIDAANVDIKGFDEQMYKKLNGGSLKPVLRALEIMREEGVWIEVGNLIVPSLSDDLDGIKKLTKWVVEHLGADTPIHFLRFHPTYKLKNLPLTPTESMVQARDIAQDAGLHYVYLGNVPEFTQQNTICPRCGKTVIEREAFYTSSVLIKDGKCPCGNSIAGVWA